MSLLLLIHINACCNLPYSSILYLIRSLAGLNGADNGKARCGMSKLWRFIGVAVVLLVIFLMVYIADEQFGSGKRATATSDAVFKAGFARVKITPPVGTRMTGFGNRDWDSTGCKGIHDDLYARALYLSQGDREMLVMGFDLLFFSRDEADRFKGAIGRRLNIPPGNILFNTSHTHAGPKVGIWFYTPSDRFYLNHLETAIVESAVHARSSARPAVLWAGAGTTELPMSRRLPDSMGKVQFKPNPKGAVCNTLPVLYVKDTAGKPVCLLFSVACHPSTVKGVDRSWQISADYPGAAMARLDAWMGAPASLFLQGAGGDAKASVIGKGEKEWRAGTWEDVDAAGALVAGEVRAVAEKKLSRITPDLRTTTILMNWPLAPSVGRAGYENFIKNPKTDPESSPEIMKLWAKEQLASLDRGWALPSTVEITLHGMQIGKGLRLVGIEGEAVAELGLLMKDFYKDGVTFPLGYTDGAQMYLPTTKMLSEGGYEVESYWEYRQPAPLAGGMEKILTDTMAQLRDAGIE